MAMALVLDGEQRAALAVVRSLVRHGVNVQVGSSQAGPLASKSRGVTASHVLPAPERSASRFLESMREFPATSILPVTDASTMLLRSRPGGGDEGYEQLTDKAALLSLAAAHGVPAPRSGVVFSITDAAKTAGRLGYPVVLKPARSKVLLDDRVVATTVRVARDAAELERALSTAPWFPQLPVIVQEFIAGHGAGVFCLYDGDRALAWFAHRRLREKPPSGGVSVLCESVPVDPLLRGHAESLLRAARYRGVAMVEFRMGTDGSPYLMEVNARFWGSLQLAVDCGVDFPWLYWQLLQGVPVKPVEDYVIGRRLRWLLGDFDNLLLQFRDPTLGMAHRWAVVRRFVGTALDGRCRQEVFRWSDPSPGLLESRLWLTDVLARGV